MSFSDKKTLFDRIINNTYECIFWKDAERRYMGSNKAFLEYCRLEDDKDLIGKRIEDMGWFPDAEAIKNNELRVLAGETVVNVRSRFAVMGHELEIQVMKAPIYENGKIIGLVGSFIDITESVRHEREIESLKKDLEKALRNEKRANRKTTELIGRLRLEMKNPLSAISTISYMDRYADNVELLSFDMRRIYAASNYLTALSRDLVDIDGIESGKIKLEKIECAFEMIVDGIETVIRPLADEKGLKFDVKRDYDRKKRLVCDPGRVQQIAINLLMNAVRFTDEGKILFHVTATEDGDRLNVTFKVKDTGCGMSESFVPKMYDEFSQEKRNPNKYGKGSGLGLTVVKRLVELLKGDIVVDTELNWGTTFIVTFTL